MSIKSSGEVNKEPSTVESHGSDSAQKGFTEKANRRHLAILVPVILITAVLGCGYGAYYYYAHNQVDSNVVRVSGRIEAPETHLAAATATRVTAVNVKEGDSVRKGQVLIRLDSNNLQKKIVESGPALSAALQAKKETDIEIAAVQKQIDEARAKSKGLFAKIFSTKAGREKKELQLRTEMLQAKMMSLQARSAVASVKGARAQATSKLSYFNITSPIDGTCTTRSTQPGELVSAGQVMLTLVDPRSAYMRGFVAESDIARIKIDQGAQVFLDSNSTKPLSGKVTAIDADPSFTPENVYFKKDRARQAYGIKITIDHPNGLAKPGLPAEAKIVLDPEKTRN